ncbi:kinase-like protein [Rhizophagus irregularis]|nr:kinase-like protein [Rhizophagus irregularis]
MKSLFSLINPIKKTKDIHDEKANEIKTYPKKSIQDNKKKITNRYQEMIKNDKKLIAKPEVLNVGDWCKVCETRKFEQNFKNWTSGYPKIDQLIRESQLNAIDGLDYFEWIDYEEIMNVEYITEGAFGKIFKGKWTRGPKHQLHSVSRDWTNVPDTTVALKEIKSIDWKNIPSKSENASLEMGEDEKEFNQFLNEVQNHQKFLRNDENHVLRCFGITKSPGDDIEITKWLKDESSCSKKRPKSNSYIMVMKWANDRDILYYIENKVYDEKFTWYRRLEILEELSGALDIIHSKDMVHKDIHCGNILMDDEDKFQFPAISDLGLCGSSSYRPEISKDIPKSYADLMKRCWDDDSKKRPKASELRNLFLEWKKHYHSNNSEFLIAEKVRIKNPDLFDDVFGNQVYKKSKFNSYAGFENASPSNIFEEFEKIDFGKVEI